MNIVFIKREKEIQQYLIRKTWVTDYKGHKIAAGLGLYTNVYGRLYYRILVPEKFIDITKATTVGPVRQKFVRMNHKIRKQ